MNTKLGKATIVTLLMCLMALGTVLKAQLGPKLPKERLQTLRIAYFSEKLNLTPVEAQQFWPVYNGFAEEVDKLREERFKILGDLKHNFDSKTDTELEKAADKHIELFEKEVALQRKYHSKFKEVLPIAKVLSLYKAEKEFPRWLLKQVRERRREEGGGRPGGRRN